MGKRSRKAKSQRSDRLYAEFEQAVDKIARASKPGPVRAPQADPTSSPGTTTRDV
jgi:hypothetical protein